MCSSVLSTFWRDALSVAAALSSSNIGALTELGDRVTPERISAVLRLCSNSGCPQEAFLSALVGLNPLTSACALATGLPLRDLVALLSRGAGSSDRVPLSNCQATENNLVAEQLCATNICFEEEEDAQIGKLTSSRGEMMMGCEAQGTSAEQYAWEAERLRHQQEINQPQQQRLQRHLVDFSHPRDAEQWQKAADEQEEPFGAQPSDEALRLRRSSYDDAAVCRQSNANENERIACFDDELPEYDPSSLTVGDWSSVTEEAPGGGHQSAQRHHHASSAAAPSRKRGRSVSMDQSRRKGRAEFLGFAANRETAPRLNSGLMVADPMDLDLSSGGGCPCRARGLIPSHQSESSVFSPHKAG